MTNNDRMAGLSLAVEAVDFSSGVNLGGTRRLKFDGSSGYACEVAGVILGHNGTFTWDLDDPVNGKGVFDNIYEYLAAEVHAPGGTIRSRMEVAQNHAGQARSGVATLINWLDTQFGLPLYRVTSEVPGFRGKVTVLTLYPDLVVRESGVTAAAIQIDRDTKAIDGQMRASFLRLGRELGTSDAKDILLNTLNDLVTDAVLPEPRQDNRLGNE